MAENDNVSYDTDLQLGKVATEYFERLSRGENPQIDEYVARYPELGELIRHALPALQVVNESIFGDAHPELAMEREPTEGSREKRLGDFRLRRELGRGGMGIVYEAEQISMGGRRVALKVLPFAAMVDGKQLQRFRNEVRAAASLDHHNIVSVYSIGEELGVHFFSMQLIRGQSIANVIEELRQWREQVPLTGNSISQIASRAVATEQFCSNKSNLETSGSSVLPEVNSAATQVSDAEDWCERPVANDSIATVHEPQAEMDTLRSGTSQRGAEFHRSVVELAIQAAGALQHAHERGVIHRDIKPANLMIDANADLFITDFGLAHMEENVGVTMTGDLIGTLRYMSPEQATSKRVNIDHRTDIYSLGITFYELLTTQYAHDGTDRAALLRQIAFQEPKPMRQADRTVPRDLETIIQKAIAKDPDERYSAASDMANDLQAFLDHKAIQAKPPSLADQARKFLYRNQTAALAAAAVLLAGIIGLAISNAVVWHARNRAEQSRVQAEQARELALEHAASSYRQQYRAEMLLGQADWEAGNISRLWETLASHLPHSDRADLRNWEWNFLFSRCQQGRILGEHDSSIAFADWSPDGHFIATTGYDGDTTIWDADSGQRVRRFSLGGTGKVGLCWSPDGQCLAWGSSGGEAALHIWDRHTDKIRVLRGHTGSIISCTWSPDGRCVSTTSYDCTARIWDARTGELLHVLVDHASLERTYNGKFSVLNWTADGKSIVSVGNRGVKVWDADTFEFLREMLPDVSIAWASINPSTPSQMVVCEYQGSIRHVDLESMQVTHVSEAHHGATIRRVAFSRDGLMYASVGFDGSVIVWDSLERTQLFSLHGNVAEIQGLAWNPNGNQLATGCNDGTLKVWDIPIKQTQEATYESKHPESIRWSRQEQVPKNFFEPSQTSSNLDRRSDAASEIKTTASNLEEAISPSGQIKATVVNDNSAGFKIEIEDLAQNKVVLEIHVNSLSIVVPMVCWSPDSRTLAVYYYPEQNNVFFLDAWDVWSARRIFSSKAQPIRNVAWASDSRRLAVAAGTVKIFDVKSKTQLINIGSTNETATAVAWNPGGNLIALGNETGSVSVWDADSGGQRATTHQHRTTVNSMDWSPDGSRIASVSADGSIKIWDPEHCDQLFTLRTGDHPLTVVNWSLGGNRLAARDDTGFVHVWDAPPAGQKGLETLAKMHAYRAYQHVGKGDFLEAHADYSRAIELAPNFPQYYRARSIVLRRQGRLDEALRDLDAALDLEPDNTRALRERIELYAQLKRWSDALGDSSRLVELTQDPSYRFQKAVILLMIGDIESYRTSCERQWSADSDELRFRASSRALTVGLVPDAIPNFEPIVPLIRQEAQMHEGSSMIGCGALLYRAGHATEAIELLTISSHYKEQQRISFSRARNSEQLPGYAYYLLAMACHDVGRNSESQTWFGKAEEYHKAVQSTQRVSGSVETFSWYQRAVLELLQRETCQVLGVMDPQE